MTIGINTYWASLKITPISPSFLALSNAAEIYGEGEKDYGIECDTVDILTGLMRPVKNVP